MDKLLRLSIAMLIGLASFSCASDKTNDDPTNADYMAEFVSFGFNGDDNEGIIERDYNGKIEGNSITVYMPESIVKTGLKPRFTTTSDDVVKVGTKVFESGATAHNFTGAVDFIVSDPVSKMSKVYTVKILKPATKAWTKIGELAKKTYDITANFIIKMDYVTDKPYIAYNVKTPVEGSTSTVEKITVAKWTGTAFEQVGMEGFSNKSSSVLDMAFNHTNGQPYVAYIDNTLSSEFKTSVMTYSGSSWSNVGEPGFTTKPQNAGTFGIAIELDPTNKPIVMISGKSTPVDRDPELSYFDGTSWQGKLKMPNRPSSGGTTTYYAGKHTARKYGDATYFMMGNNGVTGSTPNGYSLYKFKDGVVSSLVEGKFIDPLSSATSMQDLSFDIASDGTFYVLTGDDNGGVWRLRVHKYKQGDTEPTYFGTAIPHVISGSSAYSIALDNEDIPYVAYSNDAEGNLVKVVNYDFEQRKWSDPVTVDGTFLARTNPQKIFFAFDSNNIGYAGMVSKAAPYTFNLYKLDVVK